MKKMSKPQRLRKTSKFFNKGNDWMTAEQCACAEEPPELFLSVSFRKEAKAICATCPVKDECGNWAINNNMQHGIWGGLSPSQRQRIRKSLS